MRVKIIDACINGEWVSEWRDKVVDLYCPDGKGNYWSIKNVEEETGNVFINYESIPQESKLRYGGQWENTEGGLR